MCQLLQPTALIAIPRPYCIQHARGRLACDYYDINGVLISTGYAPLSSKNTNASYDMIKKYDDKARQILTNAKAGDYYAPAKKITKLLYKFIDEATKER